MWVYLPVSFLSIVECPDDPAYLLVRAVREGDIEAIFGRETDVNMQTGSHYRYRAVLPREVVSEHLADEVASVNYTNFTSSVVDPQRKHAYTAAASAMAEFQRDSYSTFQPRRSELVKCEPFSDMFLPLGRLIIGIATFYETHRSWPTKLLISRDQYAAIRNHYLTPLGLRRLKQRLEVAVISSGGFILLMDDEDRTIACNANVVGDLEGAERWLGIK